jgi:hypothetical protein
MDVNITHPVKIAFCEFLNQSISKKANFTDDIEYNKLLRNKWQLAYTLIKNPNLKKQRKSSLNAMKAKSLNKKVKNFFDNKVKNYFTADNKIKSKSTPNLCDIDEKNKLDIEKVQLRNKQQDNVPYYVNMNEIEIFNKNY